MRENDGDARIFERCRVKVLCTLFTAMSQDFVVFSHNITNAKNTPNKE